MFGKDRIHQLITTLTTVSVMLVYSAVSLSAPRSLKGEIQVLGQVIVNDQLAVSGSTIVSGSNIKTDPNSSAIISLGNIGKVELFPGTSTNLKFTDGNIALDLVSGKARIMNSAKIGVKVVTSNATVLADTNRSNSFLVDVGCLGKANCMQTYVKTALGLVTLRDANTVKKVAAGTDARLGVTGEKNSALKAPTPIANVSNLTVAATLAGIGATAVSAIYLGRGSDVSIDSNIFLVSPVQ